MDYPSAGNFLVPVYARGAGLGEFGYVNDEVESLLDAGDSARTIEGAFETYAQAEHLILEDMPTIPLWFGNIRGGYSERVDNVVVDGFGNLDYLQVTVAG
jgi:oligopeptide transport system substrate-binding protein